MDVILLLLAAFGCTLILMYGEILSLLGIRQFIEKYNFFKKLLKCSMCTGWWVGLVIAVIYLPLGSILPFAFASAGICFTLERAVILIDDNIIKLNAEKMDK